MSKLPAWRSTLTPMEKRVTALICEGLTDAEIGEKLGISRNTVQTHVRRILYVLCAKNRAHAAAIFTRQAMMKEAVA